MAMLNYQRVLTNFYGLYLGDQLDQQLGMILRTTHMDGDGWRI